MTEEMKPGTVRVFGLRGVKSEPFHVDLYPVQLEKFLEDENVIPVDFVVTGYRWCCISCQCETDATQEKNGDWPLQVRCAGCGVMMLSQDAIKLSHDFGLQILEELGLEAIRANRVTITIHGNALPEIEIAVSPVHFPQNIDISALKQIVTLVKESE